MSIKILCDRILIKIELQQKRKVILDLIRVPTTKYLTIKSLARLVKNVAMDLGFNHYLKPFEVQYQVVDR